MCLDADDDAHWSALLDLARSLQAKPIPTYLETSRRGGHLWLFFERPIPGADARRFGHALHVRGFGIFKRGMYTIELLERLA